MSAPTASEIMDGSGALLNDPSVLVFTYAKQFPYLKIAYKDLENILLENGVTIDNIYSDNVTLASGAVSLAPSDVIADRFLYPMEIYQKIPGTDPAEYREVKEVPSIKPGQTQLTEIYQWSWETQLMNFVGASQALSLKIKYKRFILTLTGNNSAVSIINCENYLKFRTASLCCRYLGEAPSRADALDIDTSKVLANLVNLNVQKNQSIPSKRRSFFNDMRRTTRGPAVNR